MAAPKGNNYSSAAIKGNQFGLALKDPEMRQRAYKSYCDHLSLGKSRKSWCFIEGDHACTWETFETYLKNEDEFPPVKRNIAQIQGFKKWEAITEDSATGADRKKSNTASLQMVMRNKYGWDKDQQKTSATHYTIKVDKDGLATGVSTETLSNQPDQSPE